MPEEWLEVAYINFDKAILHGCVTDGKGENGYPLKRDVEQVLTMEQRDKLSDLNRKHEIETAKLLRSFVAKRVIEAAPANR